MKNKKFTICYQSKSRGDVFCEHTEARVWSEAANKLIQARVESETADPEKQREIRTDYWVLFAFSGHQKQLV